MRYRLCVTWKHRETRAITVSCPSWARTRTLLIQSAGPRAPKTDKLTGSGVPTSIGALSVWHLCPLRSGETLAKRLQRVAYTDPFEVCPPELSDKLVVSRWETRVGRRARGEVGPVAIRCSAEGRVDTRLSSLQGSAPGPTRTMRLGEAVVKEPWATVDLGVAALRGAATGIRQFAVLPLRWSCVYANAKVSFQSLGDGIRPEPLHRKEGGRRVEVVCPETVQE